MNIQYRDRQTNALIFEKIHAEKMLRWLYENGSGRQVLNYCLNHAAFCQLYGKWQDLAWTRSKILPFAQRYGIDLEEIELPIEQYHTKSIFNCHNW
jgi:phosphatidylserine decarboxylase